MTPSESGHSGELPDFGPVVRAVRALSGEVDLEKLLETLMHLLLDLVGAGRGSIVLALAGGTDIEIQAPGHRLPLRILRGSEIKPELRDKGYKVYSLIPPKQLALF